MINVTRSSMPGYEEYCEEIKDLWDSRWLTNMGAKHHKLEEELCRYLETPNINLCVNGHLALENAIAAFEFPKGSEVITTPFTFASTTHAIVRNGLKPVFCDIKESDYTLDPGKIEPLINEKTVAIIPVHVYGNICEVEEIEAVAKKHGLKVIYDAAHAFGVKYKGTGIANFGDMAMFSFHATKVFHTIEGGAVSFRDAAMAHKLDDLKDFGIIDAENVRYAGGNAKMNEFCAAMGLCNLRHVNEEIAKRGEADRRYRECLSGIEGIKLCDIPEYIKPNFSYFPVVFDGIKYKRDIISENLAEHGINARKYFYPLTNDYACYRDLDTAGGWRTPVAKKTAENVLTLPMFAGLDNGTVDRICDIILENSK